MVLMPTRQPCPSTSGPPEYPGRRCIPTWINSPRQRDSSGGGAHVNDHPGCCRASHTPGMPECQHPVPWSESPGSSVGNGWETTSHHRQRRQIGVAIGGQHAGSEGASVRQGNLRG
jgi:hypothetical protein